MSEKDYDGEAILKDLESIFSKFEELHGCKIQDSKRLGFLMTLDELGATEMTGEKYIDLRKQFEMSLGLIENNRELLLSGGPHSIRRLFHLKELQITINMNKRLKKNKEEKSVEIHVKNIVDDKHQNEIEEHRKLLDSLKEEEKNKEESFFPQNSTQNEKNQIYLDFLLGQLVIAKSNYAKHPTPFTKGILKEHEEAIEGARLKLQRDKENG